MPFYEYQCKRCGHGLEAMQRVHDAPLKKCPACGRSALERLMSAPVFRLKGSGWYETDFKSDKEGKRNLADRPEAEQKAAGAEQAAPKEPAAADPAAAKDKPAEKSSEDKQGAKPAAEPAAKPAAPVPAKRARAKPVRRIAAAKRAPSRAAGKKSARH